MARLAKLAKKQLEAEKKVEDTEAAFENAKKNLIAINEVLLPNVMEELDLETFTTKDGLKITILDKTMGNITEKNKPKAYTWLRKHGHGGMIKDKLEVSAQDTKQLKKIFDLMQDRGFSSRDISSIHWATLKKWIQEMREEGNDIPDTIGVLEKSVTKVVQK